ncbi:hypothetical protein YYC_05482 [Plasmodium yoelii 17X]|uniref:Uncharacterized protein n=1 Tax=Plasmodium yoelii 17X TaxID=1323249 RepID=V7PCE6_PLAYE|nr:hypothetical protein YYC_05482 [Plasmodium yoelii 17X]
MLQNNLKNKKKNIKNGGNKVNNVNRKTKGLAKKTIVNEKKIEKSPTTLRWISLLRNLKLKQLKKNIDDEMNNYEINKNINDKMLLFLNDNLEENIILEQIEDLKNSSVNVLIDIHKENINNMEKQFEDEIKKLFKNFEDDQEILKKNRNSIVHKINIFYNKQRLIDITSNSSKCIKKLEENIILANKLISTNNLCRKYETEREKLFSCLSLGDPKREDIIIEEEKDRLISNNNLKEEKICLFDNFFKRKNKVILDIIILKKELKFLKKKNKEYQKSIDEMEDKLNLNKTVKFKKENFIIFPS